MIIVFSGLEICKDDGSVQNLRETQAKFTGTGTDTFLERKKAGVEDFFW